MTHKPEPRNMLAGQTSPYLLQHAANPVHWRPWGKAALDEAKEADRPILLSIGYAACHWCHVMAHESFENDAIAQLMNRLFVNIKVDREERPDIDQIYMSALHAMGEQGGWPLTMFLTPDGHPFWGGTYFPPQPRYGRPGFAQILLAIDKAWRDDRGAIDRNAGAVLRFLAAPRDRDGASAATPQPAAIAAFADAALSLADPVHGGIRGAPKFPNAPMLETWLRNAAATAHNPAATPAAKTFLHTVEQMSQGGIYDHLGGGLARYSVDDRWLVPHFEKMLYDNAHHLRCLLWAWQLQPQDLFRQRIEETAAWLKREMTLPGKAFASSIDADSEGEEGKFYTWRMEEIDAALGADAAIFANAYGVTRAGNFEGANILNRLDTPQQPPERDNRLKRCRQTLLAIRDRRPRPGVDDKVLADWNGYAIRALAETGFALKRPDWIDMAANAYRFICESMSQDHALSHAWRDGSHVRPALLTDYGAMMNAALSLSLATAKAHYLDDVRAWLDIVRRDHADGEGGYFLTSTAAADLITRPRADADDPNPSGSAQLLEAVSRLAHLAGDSALLDEAWSMAAALHGATTQNRYGIAGFYNAFHTLFAGRLVTIFARTGAETEPWLDVLRRRPDPALSWKLLTDDRDMPHFGMPLARSEQPVSAIVCTPTACSAPLDDPEALESALRAGN